MLYEQIVWDAAFALEKAMMKDPDGYLPSMGENGPSPNISRNLSKILEAMARVHREGARNNPVTVAICGICREWEKILDKDIEYDHRTLTVRMKKTGEVWSPWKLDSPFAKALVAGLKHNAESAKRNKRK